MAIKILVPDAAPMRSVRLVLCAAIAAAGLLTSGCSTFILTRSYHEAATQRSVFTPIRASTLENAYLEPDGAVTLVFSGWNQSRVMEPGTEEMLAVRAPMGSSPDGAADALRTGPPRETPGDLRVWTFDQAGVRPANTMPTDAVSIPFRPVSLEELRVARWDGFASRQVGPGVWVRMDRLQFLYVPSPEDMGTTPKLLAQSHGEYVRTYPMLIYAYPVAMPVLVVVDVVTLPIKGAAALWFIVTWDSGLF